MILPKIEEIILGPESREQAIQLLGESHRELINGHLWHYIAFAGENKRPIIHQASSDSNIVVRPRVSLVNHLEKSKSLCVEDLLYICTFYPILLPESFGQVKQKMAKQSLPSILLKILKIGKGYLLYYHQIEVIFSALTNKSHLEAIQFRRDWNLKKEYTRKMAGNIIISRDYSLLDFILDHALNDSLHFYQANYYGAYTLANLIDS
jgi:hypothetical protein